MRILKRIAIAALSALIVITAGFVWLARDIEPTQKTLAASNLPQLIPLRDFFANTQAKWAYSLSDSGKWLAWREVDGTKTVLRYRLADGGDTQEISPTGNFSFAFNDSEKAFYITDQKGIWVVDPENPSAKWQKITPQGIKRWRFLSFPKAEIPYWYFYSFDRSQAAADIYRYDLNGKNRELVAENDGTIFQWNFSPQGEIVLRYRRLANGNTSVEIPERENWRELLQVDAGDKFAVAGYPELNKPFWAVSNRGRDKVAAVSVNPKTGKEQVFYENERVDIEIFSVDPKTNQPNYVLFSDPYLKAITFNDRYEKLYSLISKETRKTIRILSETSDGNRLTVALSENEDAFRYYLIDVETNTRQQIGEYVFAKYDAVLSETEPVMIKARDGLELPAFLTKPKGVKEGPLPLILFVHGGPASRDYWGYAHEIQFLANRGYAVLRVNFRGSTGYGRRFQEAGFGEIGTKMQDDLDDAVKWVIEQGLADPDNIAIMGSSYGGYAALTGAWKGKGLYKAAIAYAAVSNMEFQTENHPEFWTLHLQDWTQYTGDYARQPVRENLKEVSPINHVENFNIPLLLMHGTKDGIVSIKQSRELQKRLEAADKKPSILYLEGEGHGLSKWQNKVKFWRKVETFLAQHLEGRDGGWDYVELGEYLK